MEKKQTVGSGQVPLTPQSILKWIGFSETGSVAFYDSSGLLRMENAEFRGTWTPVFDSQTRMKEGEVYWMAGVRENVVAGFVCSAQQPEPQVFKELQAKEE